MVLEKEIVYSPGGKMPKRILLVDDESDVSFALERILDGNGFTVHSYQSPILALQKFKADFYDLVILDIKMPEINGFDLYRQIKRLDKKAKVCFLTAGEMYYGVYSDIFSSLPANYFMRKPIDNRGLMKWISDIIFDDTTILIRNKWHDGGLIK